MRTINQKLINDFSKINSVILNITNDCNLQCKYCFVKQKKQNISLELCYQILDLLSITNNEKNLSFFGGEPTLLWDTIIVPMVNYAKPNIHFNITTNGTLLNEKRIKFLYENNIDMLLSIDGNKNTQNYNRPSKFSKINSYDLIIKNIPIILKYYPQIEARGTLYPDTIHYFFDNYIFFNNICFKKCFFCPDEFSKWNQKQKDTLLLELQKISNLYITNFKNNKLPSLIFTPYENMIFELLYYKKNKKNIFCGLGQQRIAINCDGNIFGCQEFCSYDNLENNISYIGNINTGIDNKKQLELQNKMDKLIIQCENINYCNNICKFSKYCQNHFCYANSYLSFQKLNYKSLIECEWENMLYQECLKIILILNQNELFLSYYLKKENK